MKCQVPDKTMQSFRTHCTCILGRVQEYLDQAIYIFLPSTGQKRRFSEEGREGFRKIYSLASVVEMQK